MKKLLFAAIAFLLFFSCRKTDRYTKEESPAKDEFIAGKNKDHQVLLALMNKEGITPVPNTTTSRPYSYTWFNIPDMPPPYASQTGNTCGSHAAATLLSKWCRDTKGYVYNDYGAKMSPYFIYDNLVYRGIISPYFFWYGPTIFNFIRDNGDVNLAWWNTAVSNSPEFWSRYNAIGWIAQNYKAPQAKWIPWYYNGVFSEPDQSEIKYVVSTLRRPVAVRFMAATANYAAPTPHIVIDQNNNWTNWNNVTLPYNQHWAVIWGYDDNAKKYNIMNSWGPGWGSYGSFWVPYDAIKYNVQEAVYLNY
jgi:hypothetical protein